MSVCVEVWGDYALFSRPEMSVERASYEIITPSAARGLIESIFWHPGLRWYIDRIHVMNPIAFTSVKRNEVSAVISEDTVRNAMKKGGRDLSLEVHGSVRQQRAALLLRDVRYAITAHFDLVPEKSSPEDNAGKFQDMIKRRLEKGQFYHMPYLGCREFPAHFAPCKKIPPCPEALKGEKDLGWMLYDMDWEKYSSPNSAVTSPSPRFFRAVLRDGVLEVPDPRSKEVRG